MSTDPPAHEVEQFRRWIIGIQISPDNTDPNCKFSANLFVDNELACSLPWIEHPRPLRWSGLLLCNVSPSSKLSIRLCRSIRDRPRYFNFPAVNLSDVDPETGELTHQLPESVWVPTTICLTFELAAQLFPDKLGAFNRTENTHDDLASDAAETQILKDHFKWAMRFARAIAEACPVNESQAKVSFLIYMKTWEILYKQTHLDDTVRTILRGLIHIRDVVDIIGQASNPMIATAMNHSKKLIQDMLALLEDISVYVLNRCGGNDLANTPGDPNEKSYVETHLARLDDLLKQFYALWPVSTISSTNTVNIGGEPSHTSSQEIQFASDESTRMADLDRILSYLKPVNPSGYNPDQACMNGTREAMLNRVLTWTQNRENGESIMWISGQPGTGKTAIAASLCQRLDSTHALAGSFFCQKGDSNLSTPLKVINSLVCDIAMSYPRYAHEVAKAILMTPKLHNAHLSLRFEGLVKRPLERLKSLAMPINLVVVVDALDECGDRESRKQLMLKLYEMSRLVPWLKLIFTGRPIGDIQQYFQDHCPCGTITRIQDYDASPDIRAYLEAQLGRLGRIGHWPHDSIGKLGDMAEGVFLWAVLATKYITKYPLPALSRLQRILDNNQSPVSDHFGELYTHTLEAILDDDNEEKDAYLRFISGILVASKRDSISTSDLQGFLLVATGVNQTVFNRIVSDLGPLLCVKDGQPTSFYHSSFGGYIANPSRPGKFHIQLDRYDAECTDFCFRVMQRDLKFNICGLQTSHIPNSKVPDLGVRVQSHIGPALRYACTHWLGHFATSSNPGLVVSVKELLNGPQLMYWIEVLSLLGRIDVAMEQLPKLISLELKIDQWDVVVCWAKDLHRFLLSFYDAIATSTPHLYISALAFSPRQSSTAQRMQAFFPNIITVAKGDTTWHACIRSMLHSQSIRSLSVSPDGSNHIVGYSDGSVRIWSNHTGVCTSESLVGHADSVTCVAHSPDGNLIATSSHDTTIRVWDPTDGLKTSRTLSGHSGSVNCVAFSPDSAVIASGSSDNTIRLWDSQALMPIGEPYVGHSSRVSSLAFSPDGSKLASGSWDKTIRVWSVVPTISRLCGSPLVITGHSDSITCVAFSPEGSKIVSGSIDRTVRAWNTQTGGKAGIRFSLTKHCDSISALAFSSDGRLIASSSLDGAIVIWNATTLTIMGSFGHPSPVNTVDFAPNSAYLISGATDSTTRVWDITALAPTPSMTVGPITGHSSNVQSITISNDGSCIISGSCDRTIRVWDAQTGSPIGQPFVGHDNYVYCVAISSDATRIYSCSSDKTVKLWDTATCTPIHSYQHAAPIYCIALSPSCDLIAFGSDDHRVYLWDPTEWRMIGNALQGHTHQVLSVTFSPDGILLASAGSDKNILLWDVKTRNQQGAPLSGHMSYVTSVDFSPCSTRLVSGSYDNTVRLWDIQSGNVIRVLSGHSSYVMAVAFRFDGFYVVSGSDDKTVRVWNAETGEMVGQPLSGHSAYVQSVAFSRDGKYVISSSADTTIRVWGLDAPESTPEPVNDSDSQAGSRWPTNPYDLSCRHYSGWAVDSQKSLVFWLPAHYDQPHQFMSTPGQVARSQPWLDYSSFVHGTAWTRVVGDPVEQT